MKIHRLRYFAKARKTVRSPTIRFYILLVLCSVFWGASWPLGKIQSLESTPIVSAFWRYMTALIAFIPVLLVVRPRFKKPIQGYGYALLCGTISAAFNIVFYKALSLGQAGVGGAINSSMSPIFTFVFSVFLFKNRVTTMHVFALALGVFGSMLVMRIPEVGIHALFANGHELFLLSAALWGAFTVFGKKAATYIDSWTFSFVVFAMTAASNYVLAYHYNPFTAPKSLLFWECAAFVGIFSTVVGNVIYFKAAEYLGAEKAGVFMLLSPVNAVLLSSVLLHEEIRLSTIVGIALAITAVYLFNRR